MLFTYTQSHNLINKEKHFHQVDKRMFYKKERRFQNCYVNILKLTKPTLTNLIRNERDCKGVRLRVSQSVLSNSETHFT